ncbi:PBS lyase [Streptomyces sp. NBC_00102]|uniref:PBS lyase n=1 Tax=Streptomyces sp. NBC_00102 TaxID=2975652 RepID=UPI00225C06C0|nr:PBS lyase [Streptomyces sp. NBC_00102]MCX5399736.1 PBS lyase [Streptomyces sp. NBC_00102]
MFAGIDEVDWASMDHAYGPADDVPALLAGLASADPAQRERALDGMYGAVHHQGDVYACTLACIPFLFELVADPSVAERGSIVELLTSIGGIELDEDDEEELDEDEIEGAANYAMAAAAVCAGAEVFVGLLADADRGVRLAAPLALATLHADPPRVLALLRKRLPAEPDEEVRLALVEAAGRLALRHDTVADTAAHWLSRLAMQEYAPGLRLAALAQLARCAPGALPVDLVPRVADLLRALRAAHPPSGPAARAAAKAAAESAAEAASRDGAHAPTLIGQLRALQAAEEAGRSAPWAADLLRTLHGALGDRVEDRVALLADQLCSPDEAQRLDAVRMSGGLIRAWRGSYDEVVRLLGGLLTEPDLRLRDAVGGLLSEVQGLAAPAADALAARVAVTEETWVRTWEYGQLSLDPALRALANIGDPRALPALGDVLGRPGVPWDLGHAVGGLGRAASPLTGALRRRLARAPLDKSPDDEAAPLLAALASLRADEATPEVLRVLRESSASHLRLSALRALGSFGPGARGAVGDLEALIRRSEAGEAVAAADTLYSVSGDVDTVLPVLIEALTAQDPPGVRAASRGLGRLGARAAVAGPRLRALLDHDEIRVRVDAALALCEIAGLSAQVWPVLLDGWTVQPYVRVRVADTLARTGAAAAGSGAARALRTELSSVRRHNARDGGFGTSDITADERLLTLCRQALLGGGGRG